MRRQPKALIGLVVALVAGMVLAVSSMGDGGHSLRAAFDSAVQVVPGQEVRVAGRKVGEVADVEEIDGRAVLRLRVDDDGAWPLPRGTTARLRWGSNTGYAIRYVELIRPRVAGPDLPDGGLLTKTITPVELDQTYRIFRGRSRADVGALVDDLGETFATRARPLARTLRQAPDGLDPLAELLRELGADRAALRTLAVSGARTASAIDARDANLRELLVHAGATFDELAAHTTAEQRSLERLPGTLRESSETLARLDDSLVGLRGLISDLGPGARGLRALAPSARASLAELRSVAPLAASALRRGVRAGAPLERLLKTGTPFMPRLGSALEQLEPIAGCLRPYGPEIAGLLSTWIGFNQNYDAQGHYVRAFVQQPPIPIGTSDTAEQSIEPRKGRLSYAMPRPPGLNAGQPWLQPQCGAGPDALDASKDPEKGR